MDTRTRVLATIETMTSAFNRGDIDGIMRTYEGRIRSPMLRRRIEVM